MAICRRANVIVEIQVRTLLFYKQNSGLHRKKNGFNVLFLTSENEISRIIYSLFRDRQIVFIIIFSTKFVVKCATNILKIG